MDSTKVLGNLDLLADMKPTQKKERTLDGSLHHPRFVRFRDDKTVEDGIGV